MATGLLYMVLCGLCWVAIGAAVSDCARHHCSYDAVQGRFYFGYMAICGAALWIFGGLASDVPVSTAVTAALLYAIGGVANYCNYVLLAQAMRRGHNGIVWGVMQSGLIFPFLMGIAVFGVAGTICRWTGVSLIVIGILMLGLVKPAGCSDSSGRGWLLPTLGAFLMAGVTQCCNNLPSYWSDATGIGSAFRAFFTMLGGSAGFLVALSVNPQLRHRANRREWSIAGILIALSCLSYFVWFYRGLNQLAKAGVGAIGYPVAIGTCLVGFTLYSVAVFKEKVPLPGWSGLLVISGGIILISIP